MMKKPIACPECKGKGYITVMTGNENDYCGTANATCQHCYGTGQKMVDMTNGDRIRTMSDEDLAETFISAARGLLNGLGIDGSLVENARGPLLTILKQPEETET